MKKVIAKKSAVKVVEPKESERDRIAREILPAILTIRTARDYLQWKFWIATFSMPNYGSAANQAYKYADALLAERNRIR